MWDNFFSNLTKAKIPTLFLLGIMYYAGGELLSAAPEIVSPQGVAGAGVLCFAFILSLIAFLDYRHKEATDNAISQMDKAITSLSKALTASAKTNATSEKTRQETIKSQENIIGKKGRGQYSIEERGETSTDM